MKKEYICTVRGIISKSLDAMPYPVVKMCLKKSNECRDYIRYDAKLIDNLGLIVLEPLDKPRVNVSNKYVCHGCKFLDLKKKG